MMKPAEQMTDGGRQAGGGAQWRPEEREDGRVNFMSLSLGCGARLKQWAEDPNRRFSREDIQVADKHLKRCSALLTVRKIQIETTVRCHLLPMRMAAAKAHASDTRVCTHTHRKGGLPRTWSVETPVHCWWDCKMVQLLWKKRGVSSKNRSAIPPGNPIPECAPQRTESGHPNRDLHTHVYSSVIHYS